jgi:dihydrofolate reductase
LKLSLIVAMSCNGVIGRDNRLPWHLPEDLKHFRKVTLGKPVVMGRKTWESIGRPLPGRTNIVISRRPGYSAEGAHVVASLEDALSLAEHVARESEAAEVLVIGGEEIYRLALPHANRLYVTEVDAEIEGDAHFPDWVREDWVEVRRENPPGATAGELDYSFVVYDRRGAAG